MTSDENKTLPNISPHSMTHSSLSKGPFSPWSSSRLQRLPDDTSRQRVNTEALREQCNMYALIFQILKAFFPFLSILFYILAFLSFQVLEFILKFNSQVSSADNFCKQFEPRSDPTNCWAWSGSKLFDTLRVFPKEFFEKVYFEKISRRQKILKNYPEGKDLKLHDVWLFTIDPWVTTRHFSIWHSGYWL